MAVAYIIMGIVGMALALFGIVQALYPVVAIGVALILAAFFWFVRSGQGTPAPAKEDDDSLTGG